MVQFDCSNVYVDDRYSEYDYTSYTINPNAVSPEGIEIDTSGFSVDLILLDQLTNETEDCLRISIRRCGFKVKIPEDWRYQECAGLELFPCKTPENKPGCESEVCPCGCTGIVQYPSVIVVPPDLRAYKHELIHTVTHEDDEDDSFRCQ